MAILTESKIRKLLKTTNLTSTKELVLEPGTIITPSAKSYLTDITIRFQDEIVEEEPAVELPIQVKPTTEPKENRISKAWRVEVDQVIVSIIQKQKVFHQQNKAVQVAELAVVLNILTDLRKMNTAENYEIAKTFEQTLREVQDKYPKATFIPSYDANEGSLHFYECYVQLRALELAAHKQLGDYLLEEELTQLASHCRLLIDYAWLLMAQQLETKS